MADALITSAESNSIQHGLLTDASSDGSLSHRRIEYHKERKPFTGFSKSNGSGNFRLVVLNPSSPDSHETSGSIPEGRLQSVGGKRQEGSELMNAGGDSELSSRITFKRIGAGLQNLGNTCFLNSVLQCLTYTEPLAGYLMGGKHRQHCSTAGFCALCALQNHVSCAIESTGRSVAPKYLVSNLRCISRNFRNARQEDAHEYMVNLLESMHKCCLPKGIPSESPIAYDKSFVHKIFGGRLRSQVKCMQCSSCSNKFDPFLDLSLEINKADSIEKALTNFTAKEYLDGGERQYQCQKCKQKVKALKQLTVHKAPDVLAVHLKRFSAFRPDQKIDKNVHFGSTLDLKPYVSGNHDGDLKYTLYGVLVHHGSTTRSGHYYSFIRTSSGLWYKLDDHQVRQVGVKTVLTEKAYMLFYVRERRNSAPKQPAKVVQRESQNVTRENCSQLMKVTVQNGLIDKIMNEHPSTAVIPHAASTVDNVKETHLTEASKQETNSLVITDSSILKMHNASDVSSSQPTEPMDVVTGSSASQPNGRKCSTTSDHLKDSERVIENPIFTVADAKSNPCSNERTSKIEQTDSVLVKSNLCNHRASVVEEGRRNEDADFSKHNEVNCTKRNMGDAADLPDCNGHSTSAADVVMEESSPKIGDGTHSQNSDGNLQRTDAEKEMIKASPMANNRSEHGETPILLESMKISDVQTAQISVKVNHDHKRRRKMRKKPKCQITSIHFSSGILLGASLTIQKKKHKKVKRRATKLNNFTEEDLLGKKSNLKEFGTNTSESTTRPVPVDGLDYSKQTSRSNSSEIEKNPTGNSNVVEGSDVEFKSRLGQHGAVLATDKQSKNVRSSLAGTQWDDRIEDGSHSMQKIAMSILTRGLEETIVARWDGIDLPPSSQVPGSSGADALKIGYVADEWDEEYDRGKRKKVRDTKDVFGGPNLFQQIATKKAKTKHTRTKQVDSGNRPFRI